MKKRIPFWALILVGVLLAAILCIRIGLRLTQSGDPLPLQVELSGSAAVKDVDAHAVPLGFGIPSSRWKLRRIAGERTRSGADCGATVPLIMSLPKRRTADR